jgi:hypothetical protein
VRRIVHLAVKDDGLHSGPTEYEYFPVIVGTEVLRASLKQNPPQPGDVQMKVMVFVKATKDTEDGVPPSPEAMEAMGKYTEALIAAGIIKEQIFGGLKPTRFAKRVHFSGKKSTVIDGPFADTKEVVAGFSLWEVKSMEEAIEWVKKSPMPADSDIDIRPLFSMEDLEAWAGGKP